MPERPVECCQCKKAARVIYKEMVGHSLTVTEMCSDCPLLQEKLHGDLEGEGGAIPTNLYCGHCHTSLESVKMGGPIGCSHCYQVFNDLLVQELTAENKIPKQVQINQRSQPLHIGSIPNAPTQITSSNQLTELNEALNESLKKENYEEAAKLRDQIKELLNKKT